MKTDKKNNIAEWLYIAEKYFDATATAEEEKALASFLATEESNTPEFDDIKAVMGYLYTARAVEKREETPKRRTDRRFITRWMTAAAMVAIVAGIGFTGNRLLTGTKSETGELYIANINGTIYTDKELVLDKMHRTMAMIGNTTRGNSVEEQMGSMFNIPND